MQERRNFIPQQVTGSWQLYGLSPRHLVRILPLPIVIGVGVLIVFLLWGVVPGPGLTRMVLRSLYLLVFPVGMSIAWIGLLVIPTADAGRTWYDVLLLARVHTRGQTVFLPRRMMKGAPPPPPVQQPISEQAAVPFPVASTSGTTRSVSLAGGEAVGKSIRRATGSVLDGIDGAAAAPTPSGGARKPLMPVNDVLLWLFLGALIFGMNLLIVAVLMDYLPISDSFVRLFRGITGP